MGVTSAHDAPAIPPVGELHAAFSLSFPQGPTVSADMRLRLGQFSITVLFGPSGCGKSTILRCLAGLERPNVGRIACHGAGGEEVWFDAGTRVFLSPQERDAGFLFQDYALFPHLTVSQNVAYGLRALTASARGERVAELLAAMKLVGLEHRFPHQISGGQQQRVALARTLARRPRLLLLDEPLSAIDYPVRADLRAELRSILAAFAIPAVVVTHDPVEAEQLGHSIVRLGV